MGFSLESPQARPLLARYPGGEASRYYFQDAAIRAVLEKLARGEKRALPSLAIGAGKTRIAVYLLKRIADAGQLKRALFLCDRDELRSQGLGAFQNVFGADAAEVSSGKPQKNARILIATYQTLDVDTEEADANFLTTHYPENYFSHIVIDECHRSAWGKWSQVLTRNPDAVQIGLTAGRALRYRVRRRRAVPHQRNGLRPDQAEAARRVRPLVHREPALRRLRQCGRGREDRPALLHPWQAHRAHLVLRPLRHQDGEEEPVDAQAFRGMLPALAHAGDSDHSWTVERKEIDARGYDLKAVNPNARRDEDTRTPEELLDVIEAKGREVAEALAALRGLTGKKT